MHRLSKFDTGPRALGADVPFEPETWFPKFLEALADEAADYLQLLFDLERGWFAARAAAAIDLMAAAPLVSATTLASGLGMAVKNTTALLAFFAKEEIAVEVTHRSKRRLFGLAGLAPLREQVRPPRRPEQGRGRGRPADPSAGGGAAAGAAGPGPVTAGAARIRLQRSRGMDGARRPSHPVDAAHAGPARAR